MREYIDKEDVVMVVSATNPHFSDRLLIIGKIREIPAADVRPVVRGTWTRINVNVNDVLSWVKWECSECGHLRTEGWEHTGEGKKPIANFCEICGAYMQ